MVAKGICIETRIARIVGKQWLSLGHIKGKAQHSKEYKKWCCFYDYFVGMWQIDLPRSNPPSPWKKNPVSFAHVKLWLPIKLWFKRPSSKPCIGFLAVVVQPNCCGIEYYFYNFTSTPWGMQKHPHLQLQRLGRSRKAFRFKMLVF